MYRVFCESYENFVKSFEKDSVRLKIAKPLELIANINKYKEEEKKQSILYKKVNDLICFMKENKNRFPKLKAFLWTISSRNLNGIKFNVSENDELEEQLKLVNSFLKLAYWY